MNNDNKQSSGGNRPSSSTPGRPASSLVASPSSQSAPQATQFATKNIGQWQAKQEGFFTKQNRALENEQHAKDAKRRKTRKILLMGGGLIRSYCSCSSYSYYR